MAMGPEDLNEYVGGDHKHSVQAERMWELATAMVDKYIGSSNVPPVVRDEAILQVAAELMDRAEGPVAPNVGQFAVSIPLRVSRDPMAPAYGILKRWVVPF